MNTRKIAVLFLLPLTAAACAEQGAEEGEMAADTAQMQTADTATAGGGMQTNEISLEARNQSGITGTASWQTSGDSITVGLALEGLQQGQQYPAHIHTGTCQGGGGVAAPLTSVTAESGGQGTSTTTVARSALTGTGGFFVQAHLPDGTPAACGDLPSGFATGSGGQGTGQMGGA